MSGETVFVERCKGINGLDKVVLREVRGSSVEFMPILPDSLTVNVFLLTPLRMRQTPMALDLLVYLYGGQVTSWKNDHGEEMLFVSSKVLPSCLQRLYVEFGSQGPLELHGHVSSRLWSIDPDPPPVPTNSLNKACIDLLLEHTEEGVKIWPHRVLLSYIDDHRDCVLLLDMNQVIFQNLVTCRYEIRQRVSLRSGGDLMLSSRIRNTNTDGKSFTFTFAYHNYFSVSDISEVRIEGLETVDYLDNLQNRKRFTEQGDAITFESEVDKMYVSTPTKIAILDHEKKRTFVLRKDGLPDAVVWNPWDKKAKAIPDFGDDEFKRMLCVEAAAVEKPITLKPGEEWKGRQELSAVPSSYYSGQLDPKKGALASLEVWCFTVNSCRDFLFEGLIHLQNGQLRIILEYYFLTRKKNAMAVATSEFNT
ncbi:unnamed protein product [Camellia sinensis]